MSGTSMRMSRWPLLLVLLACAVPAASWQKAGKPNAPSAAAPSDPVLQAMQAELDRSKSQLKMENVSAPYYIEYHLSDVDEFFAEAAFGALREDRRVHVRSLRVVVRVGDYKQDSYYGPGQGVVDLSPLDNDPIALRHQLWLATDRAYKAASEALAEKNAVLSRYTTDQPFDDFAHAPALKQLGPLAKLEFDPKPWKRLLEESTSLFRTDPKIESLSAYVQFRAVNQYFLNTEGTVTRYGYTALSVVTSGSTQAADGMRLERGTYHITPEIKELPTRDQFLAEMTKMVETLKDLREAPIVEEDYRGPILFSPDAATDLINNMIGSNVLGIRPKPGDSARTTGDFAASYKTRILPIFLSVFDDPTMKVFQGKLLSGSYDFDDEGVRATKVPVIQDGILVNYLLGREPIRDFPESNGHGRAAPSQPPSPALGTLVVQSKQSFSSDELKKKLMEICRQEGKPFGYYAETLAGETPRLLYRVYEQDGHEELVRGAEFDELDTRTLRNNLIAVGNDPLVSNREGLIPTTVISPSILLDELEVKRTDAKNAKLPEYPPPDLATAH
jgi:TldD protein